MTTKHYFKIHSGARAHLKKRGEIRKALRVGKLNIIIMVILIIFYLVLIVLMIASLHNKSHLKGAPLIRQKEKVGADSTLNIRSKKSPSVVHCDANI